MSYDMFEPHHEPARSIYRAFQEESKKRNGANVDTWIQEERNAVWRTARDYAQQHGLPVPTIKQIERAETCAVGHVDYGAKWAYGVAELLK